MRRPTSSSAANSSSASTTAVLARSNLVGVAEPSGSAGSPIEPDTSRSSDDPGALAVLGPPVEERGEHLRLRHLEQRLRLVRVDTPLRADRVVDRDVDVAGPEPELQHALLGLGPLDELLERSRRRRAASSVTHGASEDDERVVAVERAFLRDRSRPAARAARAVPRRARARRRGCPCCSR